MRPEAAGETALPAVTSGCAAHKVLRSGVLVLQCEALVCHSESINTTNSRPSVHPKKCWCLRCISWLLLQNSLQRLGVATKQTLGAIPVPASTLPPLSISLSLLRSMDPFYPSLSPQLSLASSHHSLSSSCSPFSSPASLPNRSLPSLILPAAPPTTKYSHLLCFTYSVCPPCISLQPATPPPPPTCTRPSLWV